MILITSFGEFLLYFIVLFFLFSFHFIKKKKKTVLQDYFCVVLGCPVIVQGSYSSGLEIINQD